MEGFGDEHIPFFNCNNCNCNARSCSLTFLYQAIECPEEFVAHVQGITCENMISLLRIMQFL